MASVDTTHVPVLSLDITDKNGNESTVEITKMEIQGREFTFHSMGPGLFWFRSVETFDWFSPSMSPDDLAKLMNNNRDWSWVIADRSGNDLIRAALHVACRGDITSDDCAPVMALVRLDAADGVRYQFTVRGEM